MAREAHHTPVCLQVGFRYAEPGRLTGSKDEGPNPGLRQSQSLCREMTYIYRPIDVVFLFIQVDLFDRQFSQGTISVSRHTKRLRRKDSGTYS
jgi:hypothetical protein